MVNFAKGKLLRGPLVAIIGSAILLIGGTTYFYFNTYMSPISYLVGVHEIGYTTQEAQNHILTNSLILYGTVAFALLGALIALAGKKFGNYLVLTAALVTLIVYFPFFWFTGLHRLSPNFLLQLYPWNFLAWGGQLLMIIGGSLAIRIMRK